MKPTGITPTLTAAMVFGLAQAVDAADGIYTSQAGAWNLTGSWSGGTIANGTDSTAFFTNDVTAARTTSLGADRTIGHIVFTDANNTTGYNRTIANNILTFDVTSGRSTINVTQANRQLIFGSQLSGDDGLELIGPGLVRFTNAANDYSGGTEINAGTLWLANPGTAGSGTIYLGNTTGSDNAELRMSESGNNIGNALEVRAGSSGVKTLANRSTNTVTYSGTITANDNLAVVFAGSTGGSNFYISGSSNSIAASKTVSFDISATGTGASIIDSALWSGEGSISYTSNSIKGFTISGAKTYSGGATLGSMSGTGIVVVQTSSTGPANAPTDGPFGTGTLTLGATKMRALTTADITIGNAITFSDNPTFTTATAEKSLIFTGDASLGATRALTVETGSTVAGTFVEFSGGISGAGHGINKAGNGTLVLSGANTYDGGTNISAGSLVFRNTGAKPASGTHAFAAGTNLGLGVATSGSFFTSTDVDNAFAGSMTGNLSNVTVDATTNVGIDTTAGDFAYASSVAGSPTRGLTKLGANTLTLSGANTYTGATTVSAGTLFATGSLAGNVTVSDAATLGGGGTVGALSFAGGSSFDIFLAVGGNPLDATTISFSTAGFGIDNLVSNGAAVDWSAIADDTYTLINGTLDETNLDNFGLGNAFDIGGGRSAYFTEGSLQLIVVPEPGAALLGGLGLLALLRRRRESHDGQGRRN